MVKAGGRSKWNKAKGSDGSNASSNSGTVSPSSPTRRLKKGGKRGRRLCYKEGCALCPSFGYEGDVAVSCSHHKEEGMRNLTARRCQHEGCFTVANFGMPGDKPGFCAAHSTEGMVNRNKPRGGEGMMMTVARSSRRTAKASNGVHNSNGSGMLEAAAAAVAAASEGSPGTRNRPASGGKDLLMRAATARSGGVRGGGAGFGMNGGDRYGPPSSRALTSSGDSAATVGSGVPSVVNGSPMSSMALTSRGARPNGVMSHKRSLSSVSMSIPMPPSEPGSGSGSLHRTPSAFVSRGGGLDGVSPGGSPHKLVGSEEKPRVGIFGIASGGDGGCVRSRNGVKDLGSATVPQALSLQDAFITTPRVETDDFQKRFPSNEGSVLGGVPNGRGVGKAAPFDLSLSGDFRTSGAIMDGSGPSFLMEGVNCLDNGNVVDSDLGLEMGATLDDILGVEQDEDDIETDVFDSKGSHEQEPFLGRCSDSSATAHSGLRSSATGSAMRSSAGLSLNGLSPTVDSVIGVGGVGNGSNCGPNGVGGMDFEIDHLPELNSVDLSGLHTGDSGRDTRQQQQQGHYRCSGASNSSNGSGGLRISSITSSSSSTMPTGIANGSPVAAASSSVRSTPTPSTPNPATPQATSSAPGTPVAPEALVPPKPSGEEDWWDVLNEEDFAVMPEPAWEPTAEVQGLTSAEDTIRDNTSHDHDCRRGAGGGNGVIHGVSTGVGFSLIPGGGSGGGGNGGVGNGGACLSPPKKRHHGSLGDNNQHASLPTHIGSTPSGNRSMKRGDIGSALSSKFFSSSGLQHSTASSTPLPAGFGLTVVPSSGISSNGGSSSSSMTMATPLTPASQLQTNMGVGIGMGGGMPRASPSVMGVSQQGGGGNMGLGNRMAWGNGIGDVWLTGDAISPSKRLSLSPNKFASVSPSSSAHPLLSQSTPPWTAGALCSQQTQAAGRA